MSEIEQATSRPLGTAANNLAGKPSWRKRRGGFELAICMAISGAFHCALISVPDIYGTRQITHASLSDKEWHPPLTMTILPTRLDSAFVSESPSMSEQAPVKRPKRSLPSIQPAPGRGEEQLFAPKYFDARDLTTQAKLINNIAFDDSEFFASSQPGTIQIRLLISRSGNVDETIVDLSTLPERFTNAVRDSFSRAIFSPGKIDGLPVPSQFKAEVRFDAK